MNALAVGAGLKGGLRRQLARLGWDVMRLTPEDRRYWFASYDDSVPLPPGSDEALRVDHPRLEQLRREYAALDSPVCRHTIWDAGKVAQELALPWFRGDNAYVWQFRQLRSQARLKTFLMLRYVESRDKLGLLKTLDEDGQFGCWRFRYGQRPPVSRDLLDSVNEINFLERHIGLSGLSNLRVLDIGAGYGRLAHRMCQALDNISGYDCLDAVPESTFLCEYYLRHRGIDDKARAVPLNQLDQLQAPGSYQLAMNIHSFSECTLEAVRWWLDKITELRVPWLLIVPNDPEEMLSMEADGSKQDFAPDIEAAGYELAVKEPVYNDDEIRELVGVRDHFFLFRRREG